MTSSGTLLIFLGLMATIALTDQMSLPEVEGLAKVDAPPIAPPPKSGPPMLSDIEGEWPLYVKIYEWVTVNGYCKKLESLDKTTLKELQTYVEPCVIKMKEFYKVEPEQGKELTAELTSEVLDLMSQPRCSKADKEGLFLDGKDKKNSRRRRWARLGNTLWGDSNLPLKIKFKNYLSSLDKSEQEKAARHCADLWAKHSSLQFQLVSSSARFGNIEIEFTHIDGPWNTVGKGLSPVPFQNPPAAYLKLDSGETWKASSKDSNYGVSLIWAMCHEMGHNLGLSHSNDRKAIMYPSGVGQSEDVLGRDDINGISSLYPSTNKPKPAPKPTPKPQPPTPKPRPPPSQPRAPPKSQPKPPPPPPPPSKPQPRSPQPSRRQPRRRYRPRSYNSRRPSAQPYPQQWPYYQSYVPRVYAHQARERRLPPPGHTPQYRPAGDASVDELITSLPPVQFD